MDNPKIRIESDGNAVEICIDGKLIAQCVSIDFHADAECGHHIKWNGIMNKLNESGQPYVENGTIAEEEFHYDSQEAVVD